MYVALWLLLSVEESELLPSVQLSVVSVHMTPLCTFSLVYFSLLSLHCVRSRSSASSQSRTGTHWRFLTEETTRTPCWVASQVSSHPVSMCASHSICTLLVTVTHLYLGYLNQHNGLIGFLQRSIWPWKHVLVANTYSILGWWCLGGGRIFAWLELQCKYMTDAVVVPFPCYNTFTFQVSYFRRAVCLVRLRYSPQSDGMKQQHGFSLSWLLGSRTTVNVRCTPR